MRFPSIGFTAPHSFTPRCFSASSRSRTISFRRQRQPRSTPSRSCCTFAMVRPVRESAGLMVNSTNGSAEGCARSYPWPQEAGDYILKQYYVLGPGHSAGVAIW